MQIHMQSDTLKLDHAIVGKGSHMRAGRLSPH